MNSKALKICHKKREKFDTTLEALDGKEPYPGKSEAESGSH
jgi:hypothetical protein